MHARTNTQEPKEERKDRDAEAAQHLSQLQQQHASGGRAVKGEKVRLGGMNELKRHFPGSGFKRRPVKLDLLRD
eukprot:212721-Pelagomonas_calceolata.AAC.3